MCSSLVVIHLSTPPYGWPNSRNRLFSSFLVEPPCDGARNGTSIRNEMLGSCKSVLSKTQSPLSLLNLHSPDC
jgi:hypothetical protein